MNERLTLSQILLLATYSVGMSLGQVLFKAAAVRYATFDGTTGEKLFGLLQSLHFLSALLLYAGFAILWVWILSFTPLSRAYPFVALAFAITPLLGGLFLVKPFPCALSPAFFSFFAASFLSLAKGTYSAFRHFWLCA